MKPTLFIEHVLNNVFYSPLQVVHLLLSPESHKLSRVQFPKLSIKHVVILDVAVLNSFRVVLNTLMAHSADTL